MFLYFKWVVWDTGRQLTQSQMHPMPILTYEASMFEKNDKPKCFTYSIRMSFVYLKTAWRLSLAINLRTELRLITLLQCVELTPRKTSCRISSETPTGNNGVSNNSKTKTCITHRTSSGRYLKLYLYRGYIQRRKSQKRKDFMRKP